jgi:glycosyltransferase involved in cell wall biosynthesis
VISIIIPVFNRKNLIKQTLESILYQTYSDWECIIVDDDSSENVFEIVQEFIQKDSRFAFYSRPKNLPKGANACRNYGFEKASGDYIQWFDSDDIMLEDFLSTKLNEFTKDLDFVITSGYIWNSEKETKEAIELFYSDLHLFEDFVLWKIKVFTPSVIFRKSFLIGKKLFDISIKRGQEAEFFSRVFFNLKISKFKIVSKYLFLYRQHSDSITFASSCYNSEFKHSSLFILAENFKRAEQIESYVLLDFLKKQIINLFFLSIQNNDSFLAKKIIKTNFLAFSKYGKIKSLEMIYIGNFLVAIKFPSYTFQKRWKNFNFNWNE